MKTSLHGALRAAGGLAFPFATLLALSAHSNDCVVEVDGFFIALLAAPVLAIVAHELPRTRVVDRTLVAILLVVTALALVAGLAVPPISIGACAP